MVGYIVKLYVYGQRFYCGGVSIQGIFNKDTRKITGVGFETETQEYLNVLSAATKDDRAHALKMLLDSNNSIKTDATKYNNFVKARNMSDHVTAWWQRLSSQASLPSLQSWKWNQPSTS